MVMERHLRHLQGRHWVCLLPPGGFADPVCFGKTFEKDVKNHSAVAPLVYLSSRPPEGLRAVSLLDPTLKKKYISRSARGRINRPPSKPVTDWIGGVLRNCVADSASLERH